MPNLIKKSLCIGCTACASACQKGCLTMVADENGFNYPILTKPTKCVNCGICEHVCPLLNKQASGSKSVAYAAYSIDDEMRSQSSSGGIFTELAKQVLSSSGVVYGAAYDENFSVVHICVQDEPSLSLLRGAKYAQSDLTGVFNDVKHQLDMGKQVMFTGTPCQVGGLKSFIGQNENLICIDFICHGVPSPMAWEQYVAHLSQGGQLDSINLRSKLTGWSRYRYSNVFTYKNGETISYRSGESLYMKLFIGDHINRDSCQNCAFKGASRISDITLGDFWGVWDTCPDMDDDKGTSAVLIHSEKGMELWNQINDKIIKKEVSIKDVVKNNPSAILSSNANPNRKIVLDNIRCGHFDECSDILAKDKPSIVKKIIGKAYKLVKLVIKK